MAYDPGAIDASLAAALGEDLVLIAELRAAFVESAARASAGLQAAEDAVAWRAAALRLKGLAASFGAVRLMAIASEAAEAVPHDPRITDRVVRAVARL
ncbi:MAG: Hpt domain-containing protein [Sphingomonas sp.]|uniref:Hpt domain-containing protein n=1 Tax=Sphingomonas sp. TaxID=28214 RepID=UPI0025F543F5|nr:Hpt domain-containing protein [Sphingomonas sp.]MBY0284561.1 Hpt domain-containing protein [Sphingomonas sp.]